MVKKVDTIKVGKTNEKETKAFLLKGYSTCELIEELKTREGVDWIEVEPYKDYGVFTPIRDIDETGPAIILVVID